MATKRTRNPNKATGDQQVRIDKLNEGIVNAFKKRFTEETRRDKKYEEHCADHDEVIKSIMSNLKTDTGGDMKDLNHWYAIWKRQQAAEKMDEEDRNRIHDTNRLMFNALARGKMFNFVDVLDGSTQYVPAVLTDQTEAAESESEQEAVEEAASERLH